MKLEAVTVCVDYGDFLAHVMPLNKSHFDRWVVVTTEGDRHTRDLCEHHHVECVTTEEFYPAGRSFAKAAGINEGLDRLRMQDWVLHLDADIVLPPRAREMLDHAQLDQTMIWGCDRMMCDSFDGWTRYLGWPDPALAGQTFIKANAFPLGDRVHAIDGWAPIGFFQLWHPLKSGIRSYPDHGDCDRGDMAFARLWPREKRGFIPELVAIHLGSEADAMGANWAGRTTQPFGPIPAKAPQADRPRAYPIT